MCGVFIFRPCGLGIVNRYSAHVQIVFCVDHWKQGIVWWMPTGFSESTSTFGIWCTRKLDELERGPRDKRKGLLLGLRKLPTTLHIEYAHHSALEISPAFLPQPRVKSRNQEFRSGLPLSAPWMSALLRTLLLSLYQRTFIMEWGLWESWVGSRYI